MARRRRLWENVEQLLAERTVDITGDVSIILADETAPSDPYAADVHSARRPPGDICMDAPDVASRVDQRMLPRSQQSCRNAPTVCGGRSTHYLLWG